MHASTRANIVSTLVRAPLRIGFDRARARDQQWLFTNTKLPARRERHVMDGLFEFAELIGVQRPAQPRWDIPVGAADVAAIAPLFAKGNRTLVISPCTGQRFRNYRNWRADWYAEVADYAATRYGAHVLVTGGNTAIEQSYGRDIAAAARFQTQNLIGKTTLKQLLAILARASVVLCPDSGPAHMATAVGTPGRRPVRDLEPPSHGAVLQPAPRRRQVPRGRGRTSSAGPSRRCAGASGSATRPR